MHSLTTAVDLDALIDDIGDRPIVMLGEASHGTHEYYTWRTAISQRLIAEKGFRFIAVEGDWPDCYRINRFVKGYKDAGDDIATILRTFDRWPTWMWANWETAALAEWLLEHNSPLRIDKKAGFYGLDVYSLWDSMKSMIEYLQKEDKDAAQAVLRAINCFEPFQEDEHEYARHSLREYNCSAEVVAMLRTIRMKAQYLDGDREAAFNTEQNALIAVNAEKYYRNMIGLDHDSWNIRDRHMMETLERLMRFHGPDARGIVWAHNTHVGDARATNMHAMRMVNIGQLAREKYGNDNVYLTGFSGYQGTVIAGEGWGMPMEVMDVPEARADSIEGRLHRESTENRYILFSEESSLVGLFGERSRQRAIGVVYDPATERTGNYVPSFLPQCYDALIYLDQTVAIHPLHFKPHDEKIPETYPFGL
ncbi:MAG TPA: erythromycin esterase family protein [Puia sp.]|nr:erythromycin esterase family protein [Puia sp.]